MMPLASYQLDIQCNSFFGEYNQTLEYYPKSYTAWLTDISKIKDSHIAFELFSSGYKTQLKKLNDLGIYSNNDKFNKNLNSHIKQEWQHFLKGTYGVCTKSGLVADIAIKELTTSYINELI